MDNKAIHLHREIIRRAKKQDRTAQRELYDLYHVAMYNVALRITGNEADAEDVLQESFVSAFRRLNQFREEATFGAWLKRIVINASLTLVKQKDRMHWSNMEDESYDEYYDWEDLPDHQMTVDNIKQAITCLPDGFRTVLSLYLLEGYDHSEIAEIMGISVSTSKSQYNRAKKKLRALMHKEVKYG